MNQDIRSSSEVLNPSVHLNIVCTGLATEICLDISSVFESERTACQVEDSLMLPKGNMMATLECCGLLSECDNWFSAGRV